MINRFSTYTEITKHLSDARTGILNSMDCMVGRDTYPLLEPDAHPSDVFVCSELERLNGQIDALRSFMLNGIEWERKHEDD
jgi:hypothetical protein